MKLNGFDFYVIVNYQAQQKLQALRTQDKERKLKMADFLTPTQRSALMSRIRGSGNKATELALIGLFRRYKITGWRRNIRLFGKPDFVFPKLKLALFIDGCFWHGCPKHKSMPATNRSFWRKKLEGNITRDKVVNRTLRQHGWRIIRIWQHELRKSNELRLIARFKRLGLGIPDESSSSDQYPFL